MISSSNNHRIWSLDILRGIFIITMLLSHSIYFFHTGSHYLLRTINAVGDFISFTGLLFVSAAAGYVAYVHIRHPIKDVIKRILQHMLIYYLGYIILSSLSLAVFDDLTLNQLGNIALFRRLTPFTEFIVPFLFFTLLKIPLRKVLDAVSRSWLLTFVSSIVIYFFGVYGYREIGPYLPIWVSVIFFGAPGYYSFPILQYAPVYLIGLFVGRKLWVKDSDKRMAQSLMTIAGLTALVVGVLFVQSYTHGISWDQFINRWPPTSPFLLLGLSVVLLFLGIIIRLHELKNLPVTRTILLLFGQNAFALYFSHTFLVLLFKGLGFPQAHSMTLVMVMFALSMLVSLYLAKIIPLNYSFTLTFVNLCECKFGYCTHVQEHVLVKKLKAVIFNAIRIFDVFTIQVGSRKVKIIHSKNFVAATVLLFLTVVPLGIAQNDLYFERTIGSISGIPSRTWFLRLGQTNTLKYSITIPAQVLIGQQFVDVYYDVDGGSLEKMKHQGNSWLVELNLDDLNVGTHRVVVIVDVNGKKFKTQPTTFYVSEPLFVTWTIDWEGYDVSESYLGVMENISATFNLPMTHLFNPRIYTDSDLNPERVAYMTSWVKNRQLQHQEEIGLHLHMFPDLIEKTGVSPKQDPIWGGGFTPGYDILTTNYSYEEMKQIIEYAKKLYAENGLETPTSYRAGAWFANLDTLKALSDSGFLVDSSGRTKYSFGTNNVSGFWNLDSTSQPYHPSTTNQNSNLPPPNLSILEVPNNGADSYAYSADEMIQRFKDNYTGGVLSEKKQVTFLSHPHWFNAKRQQAMQQVFSFVSGYSYTADQGPVVFTTLSGIYNNWEGGK